MLTLEQLRTSRFFMIFLASMVSMGPIAIDAYLPMMSVIAEYFQTDIIAVNLTMSAYLIGTAVGQFLGGALSDQLGRKKIGVIGLILFITATYFIIRAESIATVQLWRVLQAIGSGFASVICLAQVRDLFPKEQVMSKFANIILVVLLAPLFAPILGASLVKFGWQSLFALLAVWGGIVLLVYLFRIPETLTELPKRFSIKQLFDGYIHVVTRRIDQRLVALRFIIFTSFSAGVFMTFLTNAALVYMTHFGNSEYRFALIFAGHGLMLMIGNRIAVFFAKKWSSLTILKTANWLQLFFTTVLTVAVLAGANSITIILPLTLLVMGVNGIIMPTAPSIFIGYFDKNAGAAASINTTTFFLVGALIGGIAAILSKGSLLPVFATMAISSLCARVTLRGIQETNPQN